LACFVGAAHDATTTTVVGVTIGINAIGCAAREACGALTRGAIEARTSGVGSSDFENIGVTAAGVWAAGWTWAASSDAGVVAIQAHFAGGAVVILTTGWTHLHGVVRGVIAATYEAAQEPGEEKCNNKASGIDPTQRCGVHWGL